MRGTTMMAESVDLDKPVTSTDELAAVLGGPPDFTTGLLRLFDKADSFNLGRLWAAFPTEVAAWEWWNLQNGPVTGRQVQEMLQRAREHMQ
jgi:hypothetical protein